MRLTLIISYVPIDAERLISRHNQFIALYMKKSLFCLFLIVLLVGAGLALSSPSNAQTFARTNSLIKGPGPAVYWLADNGKRYPFPNLKTFWSWFPSTKLQEIQVLTTSQLAEIPLGKNITYRPGAKLIKTPSSPKVYAVSRFGVLHWIKNEWLATQIYGATWKNYLEDIPEELFKDYTLGDPLDYSWDYNAGNQYTTAAHPSLNILANLPPGSIKLTSSKYAVTKGEIATLTARLDSNAQIKPITIELFGIFGNEPLTLKVCREVTLCSSDVSVQGDANTRTYFAIAAYQTPSGEIKRLYSESITLRVWLPNANFHGTAKINAEITAPRNELPAIRVVATAVNPSVVDANVNIQIYRDSPQVLIGDCRGTVTCAATDHLPDITQAADARYYAVISNAQNESLDTVWTSVTVLPRGWYPNFNSWTFTASEYGITTNMTYALEQQSQNFILADAALWDLKTGKRIQASDPNATVAPNSTVLVETTVRAPKDSDSLYLEIADPKGEVYKTCSGKGTVTCRAYLWFGSEDSYKNFFLVARARNQLNQSRAFYLKDFVYVGGNDGFGGNVRVLVDKDRLWVNEALNISTKIMGETSPIANLTTRIYNLETETLIKACTWTAECPTKTAVNVTFPELNFYAVTADNNGRELHAAFADTVVKIVR